MPGTGRLGRAGCRLSSLAAVFVPSHAPPLPNHDATSFCPTAEVDARGAWNLIARTLRQLCLCCRTPLCVHRLPTSGRLGHCSLLCIHCRSDMQNTRRAQLALRAMGPDHATYLARCSLVNASLVQWYEGSHQPPSPIPLSNRCHECTTCRVGPRDALATLAPEPDRQHVTAAQTQHATPDGPQFLCSHDDAQVSPAREESAALAPTSGPAPTAPLSGGITPPAEAPDAAPPRLLTDKEIELWGERGITIRNGIWPPEIQRQQISSWKEFATILASVQQAGEGATRRLCGRMLFHFTDNLNSAQAWAKGTSPSPQLLGIIMDLQREEVLQDFDLRVVHTSGKYLVYSGVDGCSRGASEGLLAMDADGAGPRVPIHRMQTLPPRVLAYAERHFPTPHAHLGVEEWETKNWVGRHTYMVPPPSVARVCCFEFLRAHSLDPHHTSCCIMLPYIQPNNYASVMKHFEYVQVFAQGTFGIHVDAATPWLLLHKARAPVPVLNGYRCRGDPVCPRRDHPLRTHRAWANWRDAGRDPVSVVAARLDKRRTMKEKRRPKGFAPRTECPPSRTKTHPVRTPTGITSGEVRTVMGKCGRMLPEDVAVDATERAVYKLQAYWWLRRERRAGHACCAAWKPKVSRAVYRDLVTAVAYTLAVARLYIKDVLHRPALLFWNFPRYMQLELALGWRDPLHHVPRPSYQENYPTVHTPSVYKAVRELWLYGHVRRQEGVKIVNPLGAVVKDAELDIWRPVLDLTASLLNRAIDMMRCPQPMVADYMARVFADCYVAGTDWSMAYYHGRLHPDAAPYYGIYCPVCRVKGAFDGYPFGGSRSGTVFDVTTAEHEEATKQCSCFRGRLVNNTIETGRTDPSRPAIYRVTADGEVACETLHYCDDNRTIGPTREAVDAAIQQQRILARRQGINLALKKYFSARQFDIPVLACLLDTRTSHGGPRISIKPDTKAKVLGALTKFRRTFFPRGRAPRLELAKIVGLLVSCAPAVHSGAAILRAMHDVASGHEEGASYALDYAVLVPLSPSWWRAHKWWERLLSDPAFVGISTKRHSAATMVYSFSDASGDMYGYVRLEKPAVYADVMLDLPPLDEADGTVAR